jgi:hypothetical protein
VPAEDIRLVPRDAPTSESATPIPPKKLSMRNRMYKNRRAAGDFGQQIEIRKLKDVADSFSSVCHFDFDLAAVATPETAPIADTVYTCMSPAPPSAEAITTAPPAIASAEAITAAPPAIASAEAVTSPPAIASAPAITGSYRI